MSKQVYVYSTLAASVAYTLWNKTSANDLPHADRSITIVGGAGVADKRLETPYGVATKVSADDLALLMDNHQFNHHVNAGHIKVSEAFADADDVAADMNGRDPSAPLVPQDYKDRNTEDPTSVAPLKKSK